jgi:hypothetical protein
MSLEKLVHFSEAGEDRRYSNIGILCEPSCSRRSCSSTSSLAHGEPGLKMPCNTFWPPLSSSRRLLGQMAYRLEKPSCFHTPTFNGISSYLRIYWGRGHCVSMLLYCEAFRFSSWQMPPQAVILATLCFTEQDARLLPSENATLHAEDTMHIVARWRSAPPAVTALCIYTIDHLPIVIQISAGVVHVQDHLAICQILPITYARVACIPCNLLRLEPTRQGPRSIAREVNPCLVPTNAASSAEHNVWYISAYLCVESGWGQVYYQRNFAGAQWMNR